MLDSQHKIAKNNKVIGYKKRRSWWTFGNYTWLL